MADRLEEIKTAEVVTDADVAWLITEIEKLRALADEYFAGSAEDGAA